MEHTTIYLRISQDRTGDAAGVERQQQDCGLLAQAKHWPITTVLTDNDISASSSKRRPAFEELLAQVAAGDVRRVVVWHLDRLVRKMSDLTRLIDVGAPHRLNIASVHGVSLDLGDPTGVAVAQILTAIAGMESAHKGVRQRAAGRQSAEKGEPPTRRAFGYLPGGHQIDEAEAAVVRDAYSQLRAGASLVSITDRMNQAGMPTTRGNQWQRSMTRAMLLNARNAGIRTYRGDEVAPGTWPAIVTEEEWRYAVAILGDPARKSNMNSTTRKWLGSGYYLCGRCGEACKSGYRESKARVYICSAEKHLSRAADDVDAFVEQVIAGYLRRPDVLDQLLVVAPEVNALHGDVAVLRRRRDQIAADYGDGLIDARALRVASERLNVRLLHAEKQLAAAGRAEGIGSVLASSDPGGAWLALDVVMRQAIARDLVTVTLMPAGPGRRPFNPETVKIEWIGARA